MGIFSGYCIALELSASLGFKKKQEVRQLITNNDGIVSFIITKKCKLLVTTDTEKAKDSYKCQTAVKYSIPIVPLDFIYQCVSEGKILDTESFHLLLGNSQNERLTSGIIAAAASDKKMSTKKLFNCGSIKVWNEGDKNMPEFPQPEHYEIAKSAVFLRSERFRVFEVHVAASDESAAFKYRIATHSGKLPKAIASFQMPSKAEDCIEMCSDSAHEYRFTKSGDDAMTIFSRLYQTQADPPNSFVKATRPYPKNIGSLKFQQVEAVRVGSMESGVPLDNEVIDFVEHIWREAVGELNQVLAVNIDNIQLDKVDAAESVLMEIKRCLVSVPSDTIKMKSLSDEFYTLLPHQPTHRTNINTKTDIARKQELCQLVQDMVSVSESTGWSRQCPTVAKYSALRCRLQHLSPEDNKFQTIRDMMIKSLESSQHNDVQVVGIYRASRPIEEVNFKSSIGNTRLLFHASQTKNFVGILSRGLLLPKVIVDDLGGSRTDCGMLGNAIYFADAASTSMKYSIPSKSKGTRLMLVCEVALGKCNEVTRHHTELNAPPDDYHSVHGVRHTDKTPSKFKDDEFAVYNTNQQRLAYIIEFTKSEDKPQTELITPVTDDETDNKKQQQDSSSINLTDVQNIKSPNDDVKAGLVSTSDAPVPLKSVHVRAKLLDLAAQVVVLQSYVNESAVAIEAKYVFPLDEMAAVCGFEAFINGKHIVGEVKEKETAHREYKEAISQGHGAYLMDQDKETPDVFTVSVGNLPPKCCIVIKITYVAELQVEGGKISFRIPASVAPWKQNSALDSSTQDKVDTIKIREAQDNVSIQIAVEMPFDIRNIHSPTHRINVKRTACKAVVELARNQSLLDGFQLLVMLAEIHVPRMWVEQHPDKPDSRACMLTFYPEFEATSSDSYVVILILDASNSMAGAPLLDAKKILLLTLYHLPADCLFNVLTFGTDYDELFPSCRKKSDKNASLAITYIENAQANQGNTDVFGPLHSYFVLRSDRSQHNVFLVSDGHITNDETTLGDIRNNVRHTRIFTFGVGSTANRHLLHSLARVGAGAFEFFDSKTKSKWEGKVKSQLTKASQPSLSSISVEWQQFDQDLPPPVQAPANIMALFNGSRQVVYGFAPDCTQATLKAVIDNKEVSAMVSTAELNITTGTILHELTAKSVIQDWQDGILASQRLEHEIIKKKKVPTATLR